MLKYVFILVLLVFNCLPCLAQDDIIPTSYEKNDSSLTQSQSDQITNLAEFTRLDYSSLSSARYGSFPDYWDTLANRPHITYQYRYRGLRGLLYKHIDRGVRRFYDKALTNSYDWSYSDPMDRDRNMRRYRVEASDAGNRYWEQRLYFWDYYSPENGGHHVEQIEIGDITDIVSIGPLTVNNQGKFLWSGWRLTFSPERDVVDRNRDNDLEPNRPNSAPRQYSVGIMPPRGNLYTNEYITVSGSMGFNLRVNDFNDNKSTITGNLDIIGFSGVSRKRAFIGINIRARAKPFINEYGIQLTVALLQW